MSKEKPAELGTVHGGSYEEMKNQGMCIGKAADNGTKGHDSNDGPAARSLYFTPPVLFLWLWPKDSIVGTPSLF